MSIIRHNPKKILSGAVEANGFVFTAGITADNIDQDAKGQTKDILATIDGLLAKCGTNKSKIVSATIWVSDIRLRDQMNEVWIPWVDANNLPARACIEAKLADPRILVEIAVVATK